MKTIEGYSSEMFPLSEKQLDPVNGGAASADMDEPIPEIIIPVPEHHDSTEGYCEARNFDIDKPCPFSSCVRGNYNCSGCPRRFNH